jgi:16S rRNA (cytosine1402-N4)-methyltransferase
MAEADPRLSVHHGAFDCLQTLVEQLQLRGRIDGILFDLGVSSPQLNDAGRGFSFMRDGPLDMRMDSSGGHTAAEWIAQASEHEIADCLHHYGEERHARRIARAIVAVRRERPITTTGQLAEIAARAHPDWQHGQHPATRTFQAIRILINDELNMLKRGLVQALEVLAIGGRLLVISFHSLEDRIVKQFIRRETGKTDGASRLPTAHLARLRIIGKAIRPSHDEVAGNPRARSAVLRVAEKLA